MNTTPSISSQPVAQTACSTPGTASFTITAAGTGLTYQWRLNGVNLVDGANVAGSTTATLSLSNLTSANTVAAASGYDCVVSGAAPCAAVTSTRVALTVNTIATISGQPANQTTCAGTAKTFSVTLSAGTTPTYQWQYFNGATWNNVVTGTPANITYSNATTATLTVTPGAAAVNGTTAIVA